MLRAQPAIPALREHKGRKVQPGRKAQRVQLDHKAHRVRKGQLLPSRVHKAHKAIRVLLEPLGQLVLKDRKAPKVQLVQLVRLARKGHRVIKGHREHRGRKGIKETLARLAHRECRDTPERKAIPVFRAPKDHRVCRVMGCRVLRAHRDRKVFPVAQM